MTQKHTCGLLRGAFMAALSLLLTASAHAQTPNTAVVTPVAAAGPQAFRIVIVGDSTVSNYAETHPNRGWGMYIEERFKEGTVKVLNLARPGRSTKTFIKEGRWKEALAAKPNLVLIQFGHNDSHAPENPESTNAATDYKEFLRRYVDDTRAIGATPILVTPWCGAPSMTRAKLRIISRRMPRP